ncbi:MAG: hypothetical protein CMJ72_15930 [Planctomycetaceae bacterium]|nr:hypothetical protein [Planctomycetaceae bacterium]
MDYWDKRLTRQDVGRTGHLSGFHLNKVGLELFPALDSTLRNPSANFLVIDQNGREWYWRIQHWNDSYFTKPHGKGGGRKNEFHILKAQAGDSKFDFEEEQYENLTPWKFKEYYGLDVGSILRFRRISDTELSVEVVERQSEMNTRKDIPSGSQSGRPGPSRPGPLSAGLFQSQMPNINTPSYTYVARFGDSDIYKIGHSISTQSREDVFNKHIPSTELGYPRWSIEFHKLLSGRRKAESEEQILLREVFIENSTSGTERIRVDRDVLRAVMAERGFTQIIQPD